MPYKIKRVRNGFKVANRLTGKTYSKRALSRKAAIAQLYAIRIHSHGR